MHIINERIYVGENLLTNTKLFAQAVPLHKVLIVTEHHIARYHLKTLLHTLRDTPVEVLYLTTDEANKSFKAVESILMALVNGYDRSSTLIAFGGGIVCDLTGFAAAIFMRGMNLLQIPTTLLAQVDAAIGGKNGCNFLGRKNLIGTFYAPHAVLIDMKVLDTLPAREFNAGLAEVIKYGFACDAEFIYWLEAHQEQIKQRDMAILSAMVAKCIAIKQRVVAEDPHDLHQRMVLNFGHTFGHAIEAATDFKIYLHGEAVALGMLLATRLAVKLGLVAQNIYTKLVGLIEYFELPNVLDLTVCTPQKLFDCIMHDKKQRIGKLTLVLPCALGKVSIRPGFEFADMEDFTRICLRDSMIVIGDNA